MTGTSKYDYGGIRKYMEEKLGLKFSISSEEDKIIMEKIKSDESSNDKVNKIFEGNIYKLK